MVSSNYLSLRDLWYGHLATQVCFLPLGSRKTLLQRSSRAWANMMSRELGAGDSGGFCWVAFTFRHKQSERGGSEERNLSRAEPWGRRKAMEMGNPSLPCPGLSSGRWEEEERSTLCWDHQPQRIIVIEVKLNKKMFLKPILSISFFTPK